MENPAGLTPREWERRLEAAVDSAASLNHLLLQLEAEIRQERTWLHEHPSPSGLLAPILSFFGRPEDEDVEALAQQIKEELRRERRLRKRYRSWNPHETWADRLAPYLCGFAGEVAPSGAGMQFPGFTKFAGTSREAMAVFYLNEEFPGRDPANFLISLDGNAVTLKRIYRMELPRLESGGSAARAILAEMIGAMVADVATLDRLIIDNAANTATRKALIRPRGNDDDLTFEPIPGADPAQTILGHLLLKLARELGLNPGTLTFALLPFGMLRLELPVQPG